MVLQERETDPRKPGRRLIRRGTLVTDKQYQSILNLIAALVEKCKSEDEIKEAAKLIREVTQSFTATETK